jgi:hypothetical protein
MRGATPFVVVLALILFALPLGAQEEETCRSGYSIVAGRGCVPVDEAVQETEEAHGLPSAFLAILTTLEYAVERVLNQVAEQ